MLFKYNITIPLTYNRFAIQSNDPDSELRYEIEHFCEEEFKVVFRTYEIPGYVDGYDFEDIVDRICKRLSLVFIKHNGNRHLYQPRVEARWSKAVFNRCEYAPFRRTSILS